ncbi:MAG: nitronate monooxygenase family protein [Sphingomonadaceae bacterium]|uniref:NAD(P)H-dependent flavin oxidoreductase n=1 Tax=Thermaurantiacus sp. TaxID=2820283 RepID=UPI00298EE466|nr:nitronate monooxygenase family protein [Thermaurantiacus sp.]MCS6987606.1 nitronate monooxygenase family protein [Sphingomonadaceae bacterium]MDW8415207.1 nitronate monooxygenase family protein [Thermaurantiacus sp.]
MTVTPLLDSLTARGRAFLGSRHAILGGAMTWVSERHLVAAISNAGGFGIIAAGAMAPEALAAEIEGTRALTPHPFGVNLITLHPKLMELIATCRTLGVSHVVLAGGLPPAPAIAAVKDFAHLLAFAPNLAVARKLLRSGVDALVIEGSEAGGHIGPVSLAVLAQEILPALPHAIVFAAGGIGNGHGIAALVGMGASGVQLGTRFAAAAESVAHPAFKQAFVRAQARDAVPSVQLDPRLPVIPVRALKNAGTEAFLAKQREVIARLDRGELEPRLAQLEIEQFWAGALRRAVVEGDVETGSLMAGQSVGMVTAVEPVAEIIDRLVTEAEAALTLKAARPAVPA